MLQYLGRVVAHGNEMIKREKNKSSYSYRSFRKKEVTERTYK